MPPKKQGGKDELQQVVDPQLSKEQPGGKTPADADDAEFAIEGEGSAEDLAYDRVVEVLQEIVLSEEFQVMLQDFAKEHCHEFEDTEENKLSYMELFKKYSDSIEKHLETQLEAALPGFSMPSFLEELETRGDSEIDEGVLDLLTTLSDFPSFKQQMLAHKNQEKLSLTIQGDSISLTGAAAPKK
mmetsp:Transcript_27724/g.50658  ORF Transcript_27724/g.50658 Transcript_27724/m.50658 type:complete len:185 (+) Transcript_27724:53-607(+)